MLNSYGQILAAAAVTTFAAAPMALAQEAPAEPAEPAKEHAGEAAPAEHAGSAAPAEHAGEPAHTEHAGKAAGKEHAGKAAGEEHAGKAAHTEHAGKAAPGKKKGSWTDKLTIKGFGTYWLQLGQKGNDSLDNDETSAAGSAFNQMRHRIRFARLVAIAKPVPHTSVKMVLAFDNSNPLFNLHLTYSKLNFANITVGQMKVPTGASVLTSATKFVFMDRPNQVTKLNKARFRDLGLKIHSGKKGLANGLVHYQLGVFNSDGVVGQGRNPKKTASGAKTGGRPVVGKIKRMLFAGRLVIDPSKFFLPKKSKLQIGASIANTCDPAPGKVGLNPKDQLGQTSALVDVNHCTTQTGVDVTFSAYNVWFRFEYVGMKSIATNDETNFRTANGMNFDLGYTISNAQIVARYEAFDPNSTIPDGATVQTEPNDQFSAITLGVNYKLTPKLLVSLFYTRKIDTAGKDDNNDPADKPNDAINSRLMVTF